ncbi:MAG: deoxyribonuclease IV [Clostridiales bacterium]|nr:deoxyribonuclease IV [Clostridiales bacterium]
MLNIGCHLSCSNGYLAMGRQAVKLGANTFQFFTRNPRGGSVKPFDRADAEALNVFMKEQAFAPILAHAPYTLNAAAADARVREFAYRTMREDLERLAYIPNAMLNFHPGSHVKQGTDVGVRLIADMLDEVYTSELPTTVLLETMAGKGSEVGRRFEELRAIMDASKTGDRLGVCLDTCHVYDGGYDIVDHLDDVLAEFDRVIGLDRLKAIHLNDSKNPMASHKDRHEKIGQGSIGLDATVRIINHPQLKRLPFYLETPNELDGYAAEIALLRNLIRQP